MRVGYFMFPRISLNAKSLCRWCHSSAVGLSWSGEAVQTDIAEEAETFTTKYISITHTLLTRFGIESQQPFPVLQRISHTCQLFILRSGPCLSSCHFLRKKKPPSTLTHTQTVLDLLCKCRQDSWCVGYVFKCTLMCQCHCIHETGLHFACAQALPPGFRDYQ